MGTYLSMRSAVQQNYSIWLQQRGQTPTFWDVAELPAGFERFCEPPPECMFALRVAVFGALMLDRQIKL